MVDPSGIDDEAPVGLSPGTRLGKYQIVRLLGAGGMGAVYEATHTEIGKRVAVKVLSPTIAAVPGARARFLREAQLTSRVRHPNIVDVTDLGSDGGQAYLVMEFLRGEDLAQRLERSGPLPPQHLADIMLPVCSAVVEAHKSGITHRDLKPQNIFLAVGPHTTQPKVLDFGISKGNDLVGAATLTGTGAMIGTPFYLAPEQIMDARAAGPSSDQYALGVIMYECLTGQRPFEAENLYLVFQAIVSGNPVLPSKRRPGIPATLEGLVLRAMSLAPEARFPSTLSLGRALLPFASNKMRSIWEEAFADGADLAVIEAAATMESAVAPPPVAPSAPIPRPAPLVTPGPVGAATPGARARGSVGIQTPPAEAGRTGRPSALHSRGPISWRTMGSPTGTIDQGVPDLRTGRSRTWIVVAVMGAVVVGGLIAGVALQRSGAPDLTAATASEQSRSAPLPAGGNPDPGGIEGRASPRGSVSRLQEEAADPTPGDEARPAAPVAAPQTFRVNVQVEPARAAIELDGKMVGRGRLERELTVDQVRHKLRVAADGYQEQTVEFIDQPPPPTIKLNRTQRAAPEPAKARSGSRAARHTQAETPVTTPPPPSVPSPPRGLNPNGAPVID